MRSSQQKNRMRGRGRKQPNPLSRNYESNGPDVKIRGNAAHIAEKYGALARDAAASGDRVMSENYLQHAEHYNRIIAAATAAASRHEENAAAGKGPQPEISGGDAGDDDNDQPNQEQKGSDRQSGERSAREAEAQPNGDGSDRPKRGRKRTSRKGDKGEDSKAEAADGGNGAASDSDGNSGGNGRGEQEDITDDASKLPGNLIGKPGNGDASETGVSQDD